MVPASPSPQAPSAQEIQSFRSHLQAGKAIVLPTDTVAGLGVLANSAASARDLAVLKQAPEDRPFTLHLRSFADLQEWVPCPPPGLAAWLRTVLPGTLTVVLPVEWLNLPFAVPWPALGFRLPDHAAYARWMDQAPGPVWMTSVNQHGAPPLAGAELDQWLQARPDIWNGMAQDAGAPAGFGKNPRADGQNPPSPTEVASAVVEFAPSPVWHRGQDRFNQRLPGLRILVVCTGNTCRSPLAEALLRQEIAAAWGMPMEQLETLGWEIGSAGTSVFSAAGANSNSIQAAAEVGLDLTAHRSQSLQQALQQPWDLVLGMSASHLDYLPGPTACSLFDLSGGDVPDPFGQELAIYRLTRDHLQQASADWVQRWMRWPESGQTYVTAEV